MSWKNLPSWLKGGIIGELTFSIGLSILVFICFLLQLTSLETLKLWGIPGAIFVVFLDGLFGGTFKDNVLPDFVMILITFIFSIIFYFLIGALIGWIVGKIKSRGNDK